MNPQDKNNNGELQQLFKRIGLVAITNLFLSLTGLILLPILTKNLTIEDYGYWILIGVTVGMISPIATCGLPFTLVRFLAPLSSKEKIQEIFYSLYIIVALISIFISTIFYFLSENIANLLFGGMTPIIKILSLIILFECLNSYLYSYFRAREQIKRYSILITIKTVLQMVFIIYLLFNGKGIIGAEIGLLISSIFIFLISNCIIVFEIGVKIPKFENLRAYFNFGIPTIPGNLSNWIVNASDRFVIGLFLGPASVGYYSPGYTVGNIINIFSAPLNFILPATLARYYDNNNIDEVKNILSLSLKYFLILAIPSFLGLSILSKPLLTILTTPEIASNGYLITPFVALSSLILGVYTIYQKIVILEKKTLVTAKIWFLSASINLILNILLIPHVGIIGAAYTTLLSFFISLLIIYWITSNSIKINIKYSFYLKVFFASGIMTFVFIVLPPTSISYIIIAILIYIFGYLLMLYFFNVISKKEISFVTSLKKSKL